MIRVNLLGGAPRKAKKGPRMPAVSLEGGRSLILLGVVLVGVAGFQIWNYRKLQTQIAQLDQQIASLEREKADLGRVRAEYETFSKQKDLLTKRINIIEGLKAKQSGPVQLLSTVASAVTSTNSLWLVGFAQAGQNVTIEGIALNIKAVADFITRLIDTKAFAGVDLKETFQDVADKEVEKFVFTVNGQLAAPPPTT